MGLGLGLGVGERHVGHLGRGRAGVRMRAMRLG